MFGKFKNTKGASLGEYGIVVGMIAAVGISVIHSTGSEVNDTFASSGNSLSEAITTAANGGSSSGGAGDTGDAGGSGDLGTYSRTYVLAYLDPGHVDAVNDHAYGSSYLSYYLPDDEGYTAFQSVANNSANYSTINMTFMMNSYTGSPPKGAARFTMGPLAASSDPMTFCRKFAPEFSDVLFPSIHPSETPITVADITATATTTNVTTANFPDGYFHEITGNPPSENIAVVGWDPVFQKDIITSVTCSRDRLAVDPT